MHGNGPLRTVESTAPVGDLPVSLDIEIDPPIEFGGKVYDRLHLEEPTLQQVDRAEREMPNARAYQAALISHAAGVPRQVVDKLRISQANEALGFLLPLLNAGLKTGEN